ncbi:hypothetical protein Z946_3136 [Sulfitobacter noctilucicola]|uniref:Cytochrome c domain-containing protein n=1 Tax=Sulfitobacter noctilucicola TaxID=1342301 RepID=A0A7W6M8W7_9RHOB|nr:hypothetical protein [Sulfitobacter noctilucicola]KIN64247.1 hypothetical protein Z946_3136 [Sulfitobacter noctilucicola]MBB4174585.1 hypothetical protein [Sulfitobacter noctilucicola]
MRGAFFAALVAGTGASAQDVTEQQALEAWDRIYEVASHPRCTNCHVGEQSEPMWNGLAYGTNVRHGMNVQADESRIGAETIPCRTCHVTALGRDVASPAAPQIDDAWRLPPVELDWLGESSESICAQLRDPDTNDGFDIAGLVEHLETSAFVAWGFEPGAGREKAPGSVADIARDIALWGAAGSPCRQ